MQIGFNANVKLLMGGTFCGGTDWNKSSNDIDNCFKLYYLRQGEAEIVADKHTFTLSGGNLYFINGYSIHSQRCIKKMVVDWVHFHPESVYFNHVLRYGIHVLPLDMMQFQSFKHLFGKYNSYFKAKLDENTARVVNLEILALIQWVVAQVFKTSDHKLFNESSNFLRLLPALEFINKNYTKNLNLNDIAKVSYLSPNYFHRLFTDVFKTSPLNYIRRMRLEEAIRQLTYSGKAIKEIAFAVGYEDEAYFSRTFSKNYGKSPGKFRKNLGRKLP